MPKSTVNLAIYRAFVSTLGAFQTRQEFNFSNQNLLTDMLKFIYSVLLTTLLTHCKAQDTNDDFSKNINEMKQYKAVLANDDDFDTIENRLIVDISNGIQKVKIKDKTVDSSDFRKIVGQFLTTHKNKASLLVAGSFDHASMDNLVVFARVFNQCKTIFDPNGQSKIYFKSFKDFNTFKIQTTAIARQ